MQVLAPHVTCHLASAGIGFTDDKLLQWRLVAYDDTQVSRVLFVASLVSACSCLRHNDTASLARSIPYASWLHIMAQQQCKGIMAAPAACWLKKKKETVLCTSSSQLRADQAPNAPWGDRPMYTDQTDVTNLYESSTSSNVKHECALLERRSRSFQICKASPMLML